MKLTVVGSGTASPEADRVCSGYWVEADDTRVLVDCGAGVVHGMARLGLPWAQLDHLLISHFHNDHIGDVPMLLFALKWGMAQGRTAPFTVWAPHGIQARLRAMAAAFGDHVADPGFPLGIREVAAGNRCQLGPVRVTAEATPHTAESLAYRLEHGGAVLGYTGDTGPSAEVARFLGGCDLLIAECSLPEDLAKPTHLTPSSLAAMATQAGPRRLLVTHVYPPLDVLDPVARVREAGWSGETLRARDGLEMEVRGPLAP